MAGYPNSDAEPPVERQSPRSPSSLDRDDLVQPDGLEAVTDQPSGRLAREALSPGGADESEPDLDVRPLVVDRAQEGQAEEIRRLTFEGYAPILARSRGNRTDEERGDLARYYKENYAADYLRSESALAKAKSIGKQGSFRSGGIRFQFVGILQLMELGVESGPGEVWWELSYRRRPLERREEILPREKELWVFAKPVRSDRRRLTSA